MGTGKTYRWERRKARQASVRADREFKSFWLFELVLLIIIFFLFVVGARFLVVYTITTSACIEAMASFGAGAGLPSAFTVLLWITGLTALFWAVISGCYFHVVWKSKSGLFHMALLISLFLLAGIFRAMHIDDVNPPNGELAVQYRIVDLESGSPQYFLPDEPLEDYYAWAMGPSGHGDCNQFPRACTWEGGRIEVEDVRRIDGYAKASKRERRAMFGRQYRKPFPYDGGPSYWGGTKEIIKRFYGRDTWAEGIADMQIYRPMTPEELQRAADKRDCLNDEEITAQTDECQYFMYFDWERYEWDYNFDPDAEQRSLVFPNRP